MFKHKTSRRRSSFFSGMLEAGNSPVPAGRITYVLAFLIPLIMFLALYYVRSIFPFGDGCYLFSDMYHQYVPFISELWYKIRTGGSLTYSWDIGLGTNFTSLYAYYLASPVNWIVFLFPQKYLIPLMDYFIMFKMAGASLTFTYYLSKHFHTRTCTLALFGMFYGMSGYVAAYCWNIMWLDCILILPLIFLGLERLVSDNKCLLYCLSLGFCIFTNYYISIMVCISSTLYFIVLLVSYDKLCKFRIYVKKILHFIFYSALAGGLAAALLLPELYAFSMTASQSNEFPKVLSSYFSFFLMISRQMVNVPSYLWLDHYPNVYCGVAVFLLLPLYIMGSRVKVKEKIGKTLLLLIFLLSFNLNTLDFLWHGMHFPNSLPCRQSFIYIFFLLTMCYEAFSNLKETSGRKLAVASALAIGMMMLFEQLYGSTASSTGTTYTYDFKIIYVSSGFLIFYSILFYAWKKVRKYGVSIVLFLLFTTMIIECTLNMDTTGLKCNTISPYLLDNNAINTVTDTIAQNDSSFYRIDKLNGARSKNDGAWSHYHSASVFSSMSNDGISKLYGYLGLEHSTNSYGYNGSTLVTDSLLSVKYIISNKLLTEDKLTSFYTASDGEFIYKNNYTLPIGFMVPSTLQKDWHIGSTYGAFEAQNSFLKVTTGVSDVFQTDGETLNDQDVIFYPSYSGHHYLLVKNANVDTVTVVINGTDSTYYTGLKNANHVLDIGYVSASDTVEVTGNTALNTAVLTLDTDKYISAMNILNQSGLNVTTHTDTRIEGTVNATQDGDMMFSIPYDKGWSVYVDGKRVSSFSIESAFLGIHLSSGQHTIKLVYEPVGLRNGILLSILCIMILVLLYQVRKRINDGRIATGSWPLFLQEQIAQDDYIMVHSNRRHRSLKEILMRKKPARIPINSHTSSAANAPDAEEKKSDKETAGQHTGKKTTAGKTTNKARRKEDSL